MSISGALLLSSCSSESGPGSKPTPNVLPETTPEHPLNESFQSLAEVEDLADFLTGDTLVRPGAQQFQSGAGLEPLSYASTGAKYWADYVCGAPIDCSVVDVIRNDPFSVMGSDLEAETTKLQIERVLVANGSNIYDAATWQIALALGASKGLLTENETRSFVEGQTLRIRKITSRASAPNAEGKGGFTYGFGKVSIANPQYAYSHRMLSHAFMVPDPFKGTPKEDLVKSPAEFAGKPEDKHISWTDFKPITGENAWAHLLGPLQAEILLHKSAGAVPFGSLAVQNSIETLWAFQNMQSELGAFYYGVNGSSGNDGANIPEGTISVENNFSLLAGLKLLQNVLLSIHNEGQELEEFDRAKLKTAVNVIDIMIYGGELPQGKPTKGLLNFFKEHGYDAAEKTFIQGGTVIGQTFKSNKQLGSNDHFAVDVNTWGVAALGPKTVDAWFGAGVSAAIWETTRRVGGLFDSGGGLRGVGYSENSTEKVLSGEWTFGAINMVQMLRAYYEANAAPGTDVAKLKADEASMIKGVLQLRTDHYATEWKTFQDGVSPEFQASLPDGQLAFLYSSKRTFIPFGWFGNPLPSAASSTWAVYTSFSYNPFALYGSQKSPNYNLTSPPTYDRSDYQLAWNPAEVTILNTIGPDHEALVTVSYKTAQDGNYVPLIDESAPIQAGGYTRIKLSDEMTSLGFAFRDPKVADPKFYGACVVNLTAELRNALKGKPTNTAIRVKWSADGMAECDINFKEGDSPYALPANLDPRVAACDEINTCP